jgi:hypothetical protein
MSFSLKAAFSFFRPGLSPPRRQEDTSGDPIAHLFLWGVNVWFRHKGAKTDIKHAHQRMMTMK